MEDEMERKNNIFSGSEGSISATTNKIYSRILKQYKINDDSNELIMKINNNEKIKTRNMELSIFF